MAQKNDRILQKIVPDKRIQSQNKLRLEEVPQAQDKQEKTDYEQQERHERSFMGNVW